MDITISATDENHNVRPRRVVRQQEGTDGQCRIFGSALFGALGKNPKTRRDKINGHRSRVENVTSNEAKAVSDISQVKTEAANQDVKTCDKEELDTLKEQNIHASPNTLSHQLMHSNDLSTVSSPHEYWDDALVTLPEYDTNNTFAGSTVSDNDTPASRTVTFNQQPRELSCTLHFDHLANNCNAEESHENSHGTHLLGEETKQAQYDAITQVLEKVVSEQKCLSPEFVDYVVNDINCVLQTHLQACKVKLYGSYFSGFALGNSDINLELYTDGDNITNKFLREVSKLIEEDRPDYYVRFEESIQIKKSCIICVEPEHGASCDIRFLGQISSHYRTSKLLKKLCNLDPRVKVLAVALRHWAEVCSIHERENGRLHPLAFVLMVVHYLQQTRPRILPIVDVKVDVNISAQRCVPVNKKSVGELWLDMMRYYACEFDWLNHAISITRKSPVLKEKFKWGNCWIGIAAPFESSVNIAKSVVSQDVATYIQTCLSQTYKYFSKPTNKQGDTDSGFSSPSHLEQYNYTFDAENFTSGAHNPVVCEVCDDLGYTCDDCAEEGYGELEPLPEMTETFMQNINNALRYTYDTHIISEKELKQRLDFVSDIQEYVRLRFRDAKLELMGSSMNGFGFCNSDLDICMTFKNKQKLDFFMVRKIVRQLCFHLRRNRDFGSVFALYSAKIPLVQFHHTKTNRHGDISLYNLLAVHNTKLLRFYSGIDERARILGCAMKRLAKIACIADTAQKSLSSYSYVLMVIHYLQRTDPPVLPALQELYDGTKPPEVIVEEHNVWFFNDPQKLNSVWKLSNKNTQSVGELWLGLLKYYTEEFDCTEVVSIRHSKKFNNSQPTRKARLFNIEDPFLTLKNLGSVMSEQMSIKTWETLLRARKLFGTPINQPPSGFKGFEEYFFHPMNLTDGKVMKTVECGLCGKQGHKDEKCPRFSWSINRGRGRSARGCHSSSRGFVHQSNHSR